MQVLELTGSLNSTGAVIQIPQERNPGGSNRKRIRLWHLSVQVQGGTSPAVGFNKVLSVSISYDSGFAAPLAYTTYLMSPTGALLGTGYIDVDFGRYGLEAQKPETSDAAANVAILGDSASSDTFTGYLIYDCI